MLNEAKPKSYPSETNGITAKTVDSIVYLTGRLKTYDILIKRYPRGEGVKAAHPLEKHAPPLP